jgi:excisionase family DNA binding protein
MYEKCYRGFFVMSDIYLTTKDLETKYKVSRATIKKWRDKGMPFHTIDSTIRFKEAEVEQWVEKQNKKQKQFN